MKLTKEFESLVNSVRCKTTTFATTFWLEFESLVNSVRCKTTKTFIIYQWRLRALLIL